MSIQSWKR